jgi:hypothetical protein
MILGRGEGGSDGKGGWVGTLPGSLNLTEDMKRGRSDQWEAGGDRSLRSDCHKTLREPIRPLKNTEARR